MDLECGTTLCALCLITWVESDDNEPLKCPQCATTMDETHIRVTSTCVSMHSSEEPAEGPGYEASW